MYGSDPNPHFRLQSKKPVAVPFSHIPNPEIEAYIQYVSDNVYQRCVEARARHRGSRHSNIPNIVRHAWFLLMKSNVGTLATDKDGGYTLIEKEDVGREELRVLSDTAYTEKLFVDPIQVCDDYSRSAAFVADRVDMYGRWQDEGDTQLFQALTHDVRHFGVEGIIGRLKLQIKTHKRDGEVKPRALHMSQRNAMKPGMRYCVRCLRP